MKLIDPTKQKSMTYIGPSMNPTLRSGDLLQIMPYNGERIKRGDVVVFIPPGGDSRVIHRIVSVESEGIRARGDNCSHIDRWVLTSDDILGRVVSVQRGPSRKKVFRGTIGLLSALVIRAINVIDAGLSSHLRPAYHRLCSSGILRRWLAAWVNTQVISFSRPDGTEMQLVMGRRVIGRWLPGMTRWHIRRPFRLFVDEASLPKNPGKASVVRGPLGRHSCSSDGALSVVKKKISQDMVVNG